MILYNDNNYISLLIIIILDNYYYVLQNNHYVHVNVVLLFPDFVYAHAVVQL